MIVLTLNGETFLTFNTLKEFNRWSKRTITVNFKNILDQTASDGYKIIIINGQLSWSTQFRLSTIWGVNNMKQLIAAALLLIAASITLSAVSNQMNEIAVKDQQIKILKDMLQESHDREREYLKALGVTLEDIEKEIN